LRRILQRLIVSQSRVFILSFPVSGAAPQGAPGNHFQLFGLPQGFAVDREALDRAYRELQAAVHPDRHVAGSDAEQRLAMQQATRVNEAYTTLRRPLSRAAYLLSLAGMDPEVDTNTRMPLDFLMTQMQLREQLEQAGKDVLQLEALAAQLHQDLAQAYQEIAAQFAQQALPQAVDTLRRLMFLEKFASDIEHAQGEALG
jgi:molecular chaperone HscB